ncbi:MAG: hypothetical protein GY833_12295 [Aestuariibacter sp.]|nr:hypothetical protein [Aestuariibacter sp.]|tara:strand:+ start:58766 stop:58987 length:222 start_codon:yes stop_codon:yes gene_type:complete
MLETAIAQGLFKICLALVGIGFGRLALFWMDNLIEKRETTFSNWIKQAGDNAKAIYYAGRFLAISVIIGCALG